MYPDMAGYAQKTLLPAENSRIDSISLSDSSCTGWTLARWPGHDECVLSELARIRTVHHAPRLTDPGHAISGTGKPRPRTWALQRPRFEPSPPTSVREPLTSQSPPAPPHVPSGCGSGSPLHASATHGDLTRPQAIAELRGDRDETSTQASSSTRFGVHEGLHEAVELIQGIDGTYQLQGR